MTRFAFAAVLATLVLFASFAFLPAASFATDVDGPDDCQRLIEDFGDAPEGIAAYPLAAPLVIGAFPTCIAAGPVGTQTLPAGCPAISTPPGPTGYVVHTNFGVQNYWLGCYSVPGGFYGIDRDGDGKVNTPSVGFTACTVPGFPTDCMEPAEGTFDQDECYGDGSDATLNTKVIFGTCANNTFNYDVFLCAPLGVVQQSFLNVLVDWNQDGDWNDALVCNTAAGPVCVYEWTVKNAPLTLFSGCNLLTTPTIVGGPLAKKNVWMRISVSTDPVTDDYPWAGSTITFSGVNYLHDGETEDYLVDVTPPTPTLPETWGSIKAMYR
jgi:hypothetical protein